MSHAPPHRRSNEKDSLVPPHDTPHGRISEFHSHVVPDTSRTLPSAAHHIHRNCSHTSSREILVRDLRHLLLVVPNAKTSAEVFIHQALNGGKSRKARSLSTIVMPTWTGRRASWKPRWAWLTWRATATSSATALRRPQVHQGLLRRPCRVPSRLQLVRASYRRARRG